MGLSIARVTDRSSFDRAVQLCSGHDVKYHTFLYPEILSQIWERFVKVQMDLFCRVNHNGPL